MEQLKKAMMTFALDHAEDLVYEARDMYCDAVAACDPEANYDTDILDKFSEITDAICEVKIRLTRIKKVEEFDEPYEKSEKDCMWERE